MEKFNNDELKALLVNFNVAQSTIDDILKKKKYAERVYTVLNKSELCKSEDSKVTNLLLNLAEKLDVAYNHRLSLLIDYIKKGLITSSHQLDAAIDYIKTKGSDIAIEKEDFDKKIGVGIEITKDDIQKAIDKHIASKRKQLELERYKFNSMNILYDLKKDFAYLDSKLARELLLATVEQILGGKNAEELEEERLRKTLDELKKAKKSADDQKKKGDKDAAEQSKNIEKEMEKVKLELNAIEANFEKKVKESNIAQAEEAEQEIDKLAKIVGRDMGSALNSDQLIKKHLEFTKGKIFTRFPPEPNGYLHIGHAKAMRFSFNSAKKNGGHTYLRYDDTNPEKETKEFIINIEENVRWLGYEPYKITYASNYFEQLYGYAVELIKQGKAYVCNLSKEQIKEDRNNMKESPYRNRKVEENLELFEKMRQGRFSEKEACLRLKIDMKNPNTTLRDPVIYRIKFIPHPHAGDKWCIYPVYDFTHCINDSLENITHSLCTLEFEIRRDLYYWILEALNLYRPFVWEYSRLNITNTVLSKRRLTYMVDKGIVRGWDDPRMFTINGLRRRGVTADAINNFVDTVGVTRRGNENIISIKVLENAIKEDLDKKSSRTMTVIDPIEVTLLNLSKNIEIKTPLFPKNKELGERVSILTNKIYIDRKDFKEAADESFFGLTLNQEVGLKYSGYIKVKKINKNEKGEIKSLECEFFPEEKKTKGRIHWVSDLDKAEVEVRWYNSLFKSENPSALENWVDDINPESEVIYKNVLANKNIINKNLKIGDGFQFERIGYFAVDKESKLEAGLVVFNLTVKI